MNLPRKLEEMVNNVYPENPDDVAVNFIKDQLVSLLDSCVKKDLFQVFTKAFEWVVISVDVFFRSGIRAYGFQ